MMRDEEGSASVATAGLIAALIALLLIMVHVATSVVHTHQARNAAESAAVAGAWAVVDTRPACQAAADTARKNNAEVKQCRVEGDDVQVEVQVGRSQAQARAGPI